MHPPEPRRAKYWAIWDPAPTQRGQSERGRLVAAIPIREKRSELATVSLLGAFVQLSVAVVLACGPWQERLPFAGAILILTPFRIDLRPDPPEQRPTNCSIAYADALTPPNRAHRHCSLSHFSARHLSKRVRGEVALILPLFTAVNLVFPRPEAIPPSLELLLFSRPPATFESIAI
ncbi:hypothetical protein L1887_58281 [Cichorium endivia]|nr:hypothetical protein L1887_58281 [Cichorium endivia]